ncbi:MAG: tRNA (N6-threonylcarbamoyladenosine(37)-N6)-methyltransferase TrmO [Pseudomonadales bacterium]|nr:tRNA (N6-threonylcarbamoyladenosine(37)-N6)-methyltransferase TrmO [Pseudomonadales bacterium]NRA16819.1 tRNA (N6-threonylcarbamoyladenosine(37)-N6)-methyltransferase TrmO [Oceanospirillaceae bacterium]
MTDSLSSFTFKTIGVIQSPFKQKFGIPRQPGLTPSIKSSIVLEPEYACDEIVDQLLKSSHIWILFVFSACYEKDWSPKVRPPRLGGNKKVGVFASRSPFRPNPIGMSAVKLTGIRSQRGSLIIDVLSADLMHGTPVIDIKPYIPYSDKLPEATNQLAESLSLLSQPIFFSSQALQICEQLLLSGEGNLRIEIEQVLRCDPRPAYQKNTLRVYGLSLYHWNIRWQITPDRIDVLSIESSKATF